MAFVIAFVMVAVPALPALANGGVDDAPGITAEGALNVVSGTVSGTADELAPDTLVPDETDRVSAVAATDHVQSETAGDVQGDPAGDDFEAFAGETAVPAIVQIPGTDYRVNYALVNLGGNGGSYSYFLDGEPAPALPVISDGSLMKIPVIGKTAALLTVKDGDSEIISLPLNFAVPGAAEPETVYAALPMAFSEFYHDTTATSPLPEGTVFPVDGTVAVPALFVTQGTRSSAVVGGVQTVTYAYADANLPPVDAVSTATYGDSVHFAMDGNLVLVGGDRMEKTDPNAAIAGIKEVEVRIDYDLMANAYLVEASGRPVMGATNVLSKLGRAGYRTINILAGGQILDENNAVVNAVSVYAAKPLLLDGNFGPRQIVNSAAADSLPGRGNAGETEGVSYGGNWGDKVTGFTFGNAAELGSEFAGAAYWDNFANNIYGGLISDSDGNTQPLLPHQNIFSHRMHEDFDIAVSPSRFSRFNSLNPADTYQVTVFAKGFEDIKFQFDAKNYINAAGAVDGSATFDIDSENPVSPSVKLTGIDSAWANDYAFGLKLMKNSIEVDSDYYSVNVNTKGIVSIALEESLLDETAWPGSYTLTYETATHISKNIAFTLRSNEAIRLYGEKDEPDSALQTGYTVAAPYVSKQGGKLYFSSDVFAGSLVTSGRSGYSTISKDGGAAQTIGTAVGQEGDLWYIDLDAPVFAAGSVYELTMIAPGFLNQKYYIGVESAQPTLGITGPAVAVQRDTITYKVTASNLEDSGNVILFVSYGAVLDFDEAVGANGFSVLSMKPVGGALRIILMAEFPGVDIDETLPIVSLKFKAEDYGSAWITLQSAQVTVYTDEGSDMADVSLPQGDAATVSTTVAKYYDPFDFNRDDKVNYADLTFAQRYYRASEASGGSAWEIVVARGIDVNHDGVVDLADLILILEAIEEA